jgi:PAT family beta-lactamase induction signal transducer AmpG
MSSQGSTSVWLSSLYFAKGMPRVVVFVIVLLLFKQMGLSGPQALCGVSLFYLPWTLKVWWKPRISAKHFRLLILTTQFLLALTFALLAFLLTSLWLTVGLLVLLSWLTAVHNVAAGGFTRLYPLSYHHSVVQELFRKFGLIISQGVLLVLAGNLQVFFRHDIFYSWRVLFYFLSGIYLLLFFWHVWKLPRRRRASGNASPSPLVSIQGGHVAFFLLAYAFAQGMTGKASILFLIDTFRRGGVGLSPQEFGFVMGIVGIVGLTVGGLLGTKAIRRFGLSGSLWPMAMSMTVPCIVYVVLSFWQPRELILIGSCVLLEQFTYGFGFAAYLSVLRQVAPREQGKSLMALSFLLSCLVSAPLLSLLDYNAFFVLTLLLSALTPCAALVISKATIKKKEE